MTAAEVLSKARDVLAERGWHQGDFAANRDGSGSVCAAGACSVAAFGSPTYIAEVFGPEAPEVQEALLLLRGVVSDDDHDPLSVIAHWNDDPRRSAEDVSLALKQAEELAVERGL